LAVPQKIIKKMIYRLATPTDFGDIFTLQSKYHVSQMQDEDKQNGFVTTLLNEQQLTDLVALSGLFVACTDEKVIGYALAFSWKFGQQWAIFEHMVTTFPSLRFEEYPITVDNSFQYGPVCIDMDYRGGTVLQGLFQVICAHFTTQYAIGATFINQINLRSVKAHTQKLPMKIIAEFEFNQNKYYTLGFYTK
jgi:hypothetical protein